MDTSTLIPYDPSMIIGRNIYKIRILECTKGDSKKGIPQLTQRLEFTDNPPLALTGPGSKVDINGYSFTAWQSLSSNSLLFVNRQRKAIGLPQVQSSDEVSPEEYVGQVGYLQAESKVKQEVDTVTGEPVIDPYTGKQMVSSNINVIGWHSKN